MSETAPVTTKTAAATTTTTSGASSNEMMPPPSTTFRLNAGSDEQRKLVEQLMLQEITITDALYQAKISREVLSKTLSESQRELCQEHRDAEARVIRCGRAGRPSLKYAARQDSGLACTLGTVLGCFEDRFVSDMPR